MHWVEPLIVMLATHVPVLVQVLAPLLLILLAANVPGIAAEDGPSTWIPATHVGDPE